MVFSKLGKLRNSEKINREERQAALQSAVVFSILLKDRPRISRITTDDCTEKTIKHNVHEGARSKPFSFSLCVLRVLRV